MRRSLKIDFRELAEKEQLIDGEISIGCGELASAASITELFISFKEKYPKVYLDLYTGNADQIKQRIDSGLTDIGILLEPVEIEKYNFIRLNIREKWVVLMRPDSLLAQKDYVTVEDLIELPLIMPKRQSVRNEIASWFQGYMDRLNIVASSNLSTNAAVLVKQGVGYSLTIEGSLPFLDKMEITYRPLYPQRITASVLAWKKHQPFSPAVTKFLEHVQCNLCMDNDRK